MLLKQASAQNIHLEIFRRAALALADGEDIYHVLTEHQNLWTAVLGEGLVSNRLDLAQTYLLTRLRALPQNQIRGIDTLYLLTPSREAANEVVKIIRCQNSPTIIGPEDLPPGRFDDPTSC